MPVFFLNPDDNIFPHPTLAGPEGILAVGGDLTQERLLTAYSFGIFPWFNEEDPILWWSPDPRAIIIPGKVKIAKSMRSYLRKFELRIDTAFEQVIDQCRSIPRGEENGTWITEEMRIAYIELHRLGYAHSFESWLDGELVGGLYGLSIGKCFFGESMFSKHNNASKFAFIRLSQLLEKRSFSLIDCQIPNDHLSSMGCQSVSREKYLEILRHNLKFPTFLGKWSGWGNDE